MEALKPCPFCGGEAHIDSDYSSELDQTFWQVWHDCDTNQGPIRHTYGHALGMEISTPWCASEDAAVDLWNRREGRTCRMIFLWSEFEDGECYKCSACDGIAFTHGGTPSYCPDCGARVVSGDDA